MDTVLQTQATEHAELLSRWYSDLPDLELRTLEPERTAVVSVDVIEGFTRQGALSSPRVTAIIPNVVSLLERLSELGVPSTQVAFVQDAHPENAEEFGAYPPHCVAGTEEAEAVRELQALPNWPRVPTLSKEQHRQPHQRRF